MIKYMVLSPQGDLISHCHPARARQLIKNGRAEIIKALPHTIRLYTDPRQTLYPYR